ncbi:protease modulator HflC [Psychrobacillus psychrodurans]|uniref:Protein HflC n=1 Tax=Psychrobacillus psychrodurans TaxID=126157 RepID=A0A9X3R9M2_9BACI|nr:protease modulator HflC [Psychrobacillus psychrodurans]MCZ8533146.1 protease modulator HflC [Psychrobacillus psychrodurans]
MAENKNPFSNLEAKFKTVENKASNAPKEKKSVDYKKYTKPFIAIFLVFVLFIIALANIFVVKEGEFKVIRQFGEIKDVKDTPGIHMKIPFVQTVTTVPKYQMNYKLSEAEINTKDKRRIIIDNYAVWRVVNVKEMISSAGTLVGAGSRMEEFIYSVVRSELGQLNYNEIINDENSSRGSLNDQITSHVNELLKKDNYGIEVIDVRIKRTDLPQENEQSVYNEMISERQSIAQKFLSTGDADKRRIEAETDREVREMLATANKDASIIAAEGDAEAAKIYNQSFSKDPEFYSLYRTLESYKKTIGDETMIIIPSDSPYANILSGYLE